MIVCTHCYEIIENDEAAHTPCPYCGYILPDPEPEPEPTPEPEPMPAMDAMGQPGMAGQPGMPGMAGTGAMEALELEQARKKKNMMYIIGGVAVVVLAAIGYVVFGGGGEAPKGKKAAVQKKGINPKFVASLKDFKKRINTEILQKFFAKNCADFRSVGYAFTTKLVLDDQGNWRGLIEPGSGSEADSSWFMCPVELLKIRDQADMTLVLNVRYQKRRSWKGSDTHWTRIELKGKSVKEPEDIDLSKELYTNWAFNPAKRELRISIPKLRRGPEALAAINGTYTLHGWKFDAHGTVVRLVKKKGPPAFGRWEARIPGWFGKTRTLGLKNWGTGCKLDVVDRIAKIRKDMVAAHTYIEDAMLDDKLRPMVEKFEAIAREKGEKLCSVMPKVYEALTLFDKGNASAAEGIIKELETTLPDIEKELNTALDGYIDGLGK